MAADKSTPLIEKLFVPELAQALLAADESGREQLLKQALAKATAALPAIVRGYSADAELDEGELAIANDLCEYKMILRDGSALDMGLPYDWYCGVRDGRVGEAAPRYIHPRIAFAGVLARAHRSTGKAVYAEVLRNYIIDYVSRYWIDSTELTEKDNWLCTSCRCGSWHGKRFAGIYAALMRLGDLSAFSFADLLAIFRAIANMMTGLIPNLALGSNWRVHELTNIFTQGLCYPFLKDSADWLELAVNSLNEEFEVQFHDDGSHEELCVGYGAGTWGVFADYFLLASQAPDVGLQFDHGKMERILEYYLSACKPFGLTAAIGDVYAIRNAAMLDGQSPPHRNSEPPAWDATVYRGAELLAQAAAFPAADFVQTGAPIPAWTSRLHRNSGYMFMRDGWTPESLYANFNLGHYTNCHCHYGLLGIELAGYGREFVVDPGNSSLDPREINQNFGRTRAHSTVCVDGNDQQVAAPVQISRLSLGEHCDFAVGVYKGGYTQGNPYGPGCTSAGQFDNCFAGQHFRHVLFVKGSYWVVFDALSTRPGHVAETRFQFLPNTIQPLPTGGYATGWPESNVALLPLHWDGWQHEILAGQEDPIEGWIPEQQGALLPAPVYRATSPTDRAPCWHGSLFFPYRQATMPAITVTPLDVGPAGFAYRIETDAYTDYLFLSNSWMPCDIVMDDIATNAVCLHVRCESGEPVRAFACEGGYLTIRDRDIFRAPGTMLAREFTFGAAPSCPTQNPRYQNH